MSFDSELRELYYNNRQNAYHNQNIYDNENRLFFIYILNELIENSPNNIRHIDNIGKIKQIYYNEDFREIYKDKNLDLYFGHTRSLKTKEMIILELYFI